MASYLDLRIIRDEIDADPLVPARGYAAMVDDSGLPDLPNWMSRADKISADLRTAYRDVPLTTLTGAAIYEAFDDTEYDALSDGAQTQVDAITRMQGPIQVGPGSTARATIVRAFTGGSTTVSNLATTVARTITRAAELGVAARVGHVQEALRL